ncbi:U2 small nuclear ribonucleoprotein auxiliary factor 35 kDa subunit-related protein 2 [Oryzias melastigma]|uniref:U2 small nuclear ribonucleoprotein auxiliary factor 35 kDa subunit-related protein 2 n=1 Tax=Oryzias melastigma TaxID=30732 RepID=UPI000CF806E9|nr:U2 small nuclear ribonucleoprotein auxiliary factor 35 kDa subunit-related protein 2 [Oryzias melastigma]
MAASIPGQISAPILSQKQRKAAQRKERRRRKRQAVAQSKEPDVQGEAEEESIGDEEDGEDNDCAEEERLRLHEEWLERERLAQEEFRLRMEREETARKRKEEEERMIKEEWEAQQRREQEEKEQRLQERRDREEAVQKMLDEAENQLEHKGPWMNPEAPVTTNSENYGTERDVANCPFFLKTGACRFGERCSRKHVYPTSSPTLMIRGMFMTFGMEELRRDDYDMDACLEHSEEDLHDSFLEFYHDVLPEFKSVGKVVQFKVCCNYEPHLKGNVYIQFETDDQCKEALMKFNGRWYAGRQLQCEISPVTRWKNAICGLFDRRKCPKGKHCNFLHVFRNPGNEFWEADRDLHLSPDRSLQASRRDGWYSERSRERSSRYSRYSRSPVRSERSRSRRENDRHRSRSRSREVRSPHRDKGSSRSRHRDKGVDRYRSRSRERRRRSRSRDRESKFKDKSEERDCGDEKSRSTSRERKRRKRSRDRSSKKPDKSKKSTTEENSPSHQKRSKKRKKSKKKHKRKSPKSDSSGESNRENKSDGEAVDPPSTQSSSEDINEMEKTLEKSVHEKDFSLQTNVESEPARNGHTCE